MVAAGERVSAVGLRSGIWAGVLLTLVVAVPTLVLAEDWHGRPLIDQGGYGWLVPALVTALAFAGGGAVAGRRAGRAGLALAHGLAVGALAVLVLLAADVARRVLMNPTLPLGVVYYWLDGAAAATFLSVVGALAGHRMLRTAAPRTAPIAGRPVDEERPVAGRR